MPICRALSWASIYWQYIAPGSTSLLPERGARIPGSWPFTYVPLQPLKLQRKPIHTCGQIRDCLEIQVKMNDFFSSSEAKSRKIVPPAGRLQRGPPGRLRRDPLTSRARRWSRRRRDQILVGSRLLTAGILLLAKTTRTKPYQFVWSSRGDS